VDPRLKAEDDNRERHTMLTLYTFHNSICTQKVFITLAEKELDYEEKLVNLFAAEQFDPEYLKLNPKGVVPTLIHEGRAIPESSLICEYIDETWPDNGLVPDDPYLKTRMRQFSKLVDEAIFEATRELSFSAMFRERMKNMPDEQRETRFRNVGDPSKRDRFMSTYELGVDSPYVFQAIGNWEKALKAMETELKTSGGPWLLGEMFTLADINMIPYLWRIEYLDLLDIWLDDKTLVQEWWAGAKERPSAAKSIAGRLKPEDAEEMRMHGTKLREAVAAKRAEYLELAPH
jgi:glutathione S-transferase